MHMARPSRSSLRTAFLAVVALALCVPFGAFGAAPAMAAPLTAVAVSAGGADSCAVMSDATARCWGFNAGGELGDGTTTNQSLPDVVLNTAGTAPLGNISQVAAGDTSCALLTGGTLDCWGDNRYGELGIGTKSGPQTCGVSPCSELPVQVENSAGTGPLTGVVSVAVGGFAVCAVLHDATADCWGAQNPTDPQSAVALPTALTDNSQLSPQPGITTVAIGTDHLCALLADTTARCWGQASFGQLGNGGQIAGGSPFTVQTPDGAAALSGITALGAGEHHTCALLSGGAVDCWGFNASGQVGNGGNGSEWRPVPVQNAEGSGTLTGAGGIAVSGDSSCALMSDGTARCWGDNEDWVLGNGGIVANNPDWCNGCSAEAVTVENQAGTGPLTGIASLVGADSLHFCALLDDGTVQCWGDNDNSQLGDGTTQSRCVPVTVGVVSPADVPPAAPTTVSAVVGDRQATVYWLAPPQVPDDCRQPFGYSITASPGGTTITPDTRFLLAGAGGTKGAVFSDLTPGVSYTFTVRATNATGFGAPSTPSNAVTPTGLSAAPPDAPSHVTATPGNGEVTVSWTAPKTNGAAINLYSVRSTDLSAGIGIPGTRTHVTFAGVTNGKTYTFTVSATNSAGTGALSAPSNLVLIGTPSPAVSPSVTPGNARATIKWKAPANNGSAITGYTVTPVLGAVAQTARAAHTTATTVTIAGLANAKAYTFRIVAKNSRGTGAIATTAPAVVGTPTAPGGVKAVKVSAGSLSVTFAAGANNGAPVTKYTAACTSSNGGGAKSNTGTAGPIADTGLTAGKIYTCTITATNSRGTGPQSAPSAAVRA